jgi:hypothetical protein
MGTCQKIMRNYFVKCEPVKENVNCNLWLKPLHKWTQSLSIIAVLFVSVTESIFDGISDSPDRNHKYLSLLSILGGTVLYHFSNILCLVTQPFSKVSLVQFVGLSIMLQGFCWQASLGVPDLNESVDPGYFWISRIQIVSGGLVGLSASSFRLFQSFWPYIDKFLFSVGRMHAHRYLEAMDIEARGDFKVYSSRSFSCETEAGDSAF